MPMRWMPSSAMAAAKRFLANGGGHIRTAGVYNAGFPHRFTLEGV